MTSRLRPRCRYALLGAALLMPGLPMMLGSLSAGPAFAQAPPSAEKEAFEAAKELGTVEAWDAFLSNFPTGFHADLARAYVKKLASEPARPSPPPAPEAMRAANELPCSVAGKLKSQRSSEPVKLRFVNDSNARRVIQWIDFKGGLKEYAVLEPGAEYVQDTFISHPWIAAYEEGSCRQLFLPGSGITVARLLPDEPRERAPSGSSSSGSSSSKKKTKMERATTREESDHGPTPEQTCRDIGQDYNGAECVPRKKKTPTVTLPSKNVIERRARAACIELGMIYLNGKCQPKTKTERDTANKNKSKPCPAGMYRNPYGQCQPNETGG